MTSQDAASEFVGFVDLARRRHVVFYYVGYFSQNIVAAMAEAIRFRLEASGASSATRRKLFSAFVEMAQNIIHYSSDTLTPPDQTVSEMRHGSLCIGLEGERYHLICANPVSTDSLEKIRAALEPLRSMTVEQIKAAYRETLRAEAPEDSKGAGLGFLTVARDASAPLEFEFAPASGAPGQTMFYLKAVI